MVTHILKGFFNCYLAVPQPTLSNYLGDSLSHLILITTFLQFWPKAHVKTCNKVKSVSTAKCVVGFGPGNSWFWLQCLKPLGHSPEVVLYILLNLSFKMQITAKKFKYGFICAFQFAIKVLLRPYYLHGSKQELWTPSSWFEYIQKTMWEVK